MKTFLHLGAGLLRALWAVTVGLFALFALFLQIFVPGEQTEEDAAFEEEIARDFRDATGTLRQDELGLARYPQPGDPEY